MFFDGNVEDFSTLIVSVVGLGSMGVDLHRFSFP